MMHNNEIWYLICYSHLDLLSFSQPVHHHHHRCTYEKYDNAKCSLACISRYLNCSLAIVNSDVFMYAPAFLLVHLYPSSSPCTMRTGPRAWHLTTISLSPLVFPLYSKIHQISQLSFVLLASRARCCSTALIGYKTSITTSSDTVF